MRTLRPRPSGQIEDFFIPTERKSSLRSQAYPSATTTAKRCVDSNTTKYQKQSPSRKRETVVNINGDESEPETLSPPTKRSKANKATQSYPSPPSEKGELTKTPSEETKTMPVTVLLDLPLEIQQNIIGFLPSDKDVNNYGAACKVLRACVGPIVWQQRFLRVFDNIPGADPVKLQAQYKKRQGIAKRFVSYEDKTLTGKKACLEMIKEMIIESNAHVVRGEEDDEFVNGLNHRFFVEYFQYMAPDGRHKGTDLLENAAGSVDRPNPKRVLRSLPMVIKLCFVHLILHPDFCNIRTNVFLASQEQVYTCLTKEPLFLGKNKYQINMPWLLHAVNFFKFHFKTPDGEGILAHMYQQLDKDELPKAWTGKVRSGTQKLGPHWKGAFTFLHEDDLEHFRLGNLYGNVVDETTDGNNGFQDLTLFSDLKNAPPLAYPPAIDEWLQGSPKGEYTDGVSGEKVMPKVQDFFGLGRSDVEYYLHGRMHALPPQEGIPGFQRVSMLKYLPCPHGVYGTDHTTYWAYEGCVLPGNQIMLGRWWSPNGSMERGLTYCGPFIFWRVSGSAEDKMRTIDDAVAFLDRVEYPTVG
ncbi:hypothetical protein V496_09025 [Pseudogymnoascus sp. VKM F-4515 (FW-2607)]|nr:hypothetical protein V496_09025 [Pseudogymnoascus sp. VKM F-4515 (FW-2607)]